MNLGHEATTVDVLFFEGGLLGVGLVTVGVDQGCVDDVFVFVLVDDGVI